MDYATVLGFVATALTVYSFVPQIWRTVKTKKTTDLSMGMYVTLLAGFLLWLAYGVMTGSAPLVVANILDVGFAVSIIVMKLKYG